MYFVLINTSMLLIILWTILKQIERDIFGLMTHLDNMKKCSIDCFKTPYWNFNIVPCSNIQIWHDSMMKVKDILLIKNDSWIVIQ